MKLHNKIASWSIIAVATLGAGLACMPPPVLPLAYVDTQPPPPQDEAVPQPKAGFVWVRGYWEFLGGKWVWHGGAWQAAREGATWRDGHWERRDDHYHWVEGRWSGPPASAAGSAEPQ